MHNYHDTHGTLPFGFDERETGWHAMILPQIEQANLYDTLIWQESGPGNWNSNGSPNEEAAGTYISVFRCPSMAQPEHVNNSGIPKRVPVSYKGSASSIAGSDDESTIPAAAMTTVALENQSLDGVLYECSSIKFRDIVDGTSNTILIGETYTDIELVRDGQAMDYWQMGAPSTGGWDCIPGDRGGTEYSELIGATNAPINSALNPAIDGWRAELSYGSYHAGGAQFVLCDGSVRFISENVDLIAVLRAMVTRHGSEVVSEF